MVGAIVFDDGVDHGIAHGEQDLLLGGFREDGFYSVPPEGPGDLFALLVDCRGIRSDEVAVGGAANLIRRPVGDPFHDVHWDDREGLGRLSGLSG